MKCLRPWAAGLVAALSINGLAADAQQSGRPRSSQPETMTAGSPDVDGRLKMAAAQVIREGVVLFNEQRDSLGCYRLYQGALLGLEPMLADRAELQSAVAIGLERAAGLAASDSARAAFELRGLLDRIFEESAGASPSSQPLWDRLGGEPAVRAVVHDFVALAAGDEEVNFFRDGQYALDAAGVEHLEQLLVEFISSATGGPLDYTGRAMEPVHEGMNISEAEFKAIAADLVAVLRKYEVPDTEIDELIAIVGTTRDAIVEVPPLWDRLGGEPAVRAVVADFVQRAATNPEVNFFRDGRFPLDADGVEHLEQLLVEFISSATGGPLDYTGRAMEPVHEGMNISEEEFNAIAGDLITSLEAFEVPRELIDELVGIVATTKDAIVEEP